jgi:hypothetical protein
MQLPKTIFLDSAIFIEQPLVANRGLRAWLEAAGDPE